MIRPTPPLPAAITGYRAIDRRARHDGWTPVRQYHFLLTLADKGKIAAACRAAGVTRQSAYRLRADPRAAAFAAAWDAALDHRSEQAARNATGPSNHQACCILRLRDPGRYRLGPDDGW